MKMDSKYWIQRALQQEQNAQIVSDRYMANVGRQLASYRQDLISEIETFYARYAKDNKMSHAEAKRYLRDNEMKEFQGVTLEKFRAMALNPDTPTPLLDALSYRHRISRKEALLAEIERKTAELYGGKDGIADNVVNNMSEVYVKGKIQQMKNLADFGIVENPILNLKAVQNKLATNWSGQEFSERIWGQSQRTFNSIQKVIDQGLTGGWSVDRMSKELILRTGVAYSQVETLVRTETTFYNNLATLDTIKDLGGEYYEIVAVLDTRTSDICRHENKKIYPISEYKAGQTAPPFHVRCRSTIMPSHQSKDGEKSDNPYIDILMNDHKVNVAPSDKSLNDVFDEWEREGNRLLGKVDSNSVSEVVHELKANEADEFFKAQKSYKKWYNELDETQKDAIFNYTMSPHEQINSLMRKGYEDYRNSALLGVEASEIPYVEKYLKENLELSKRLESIFGSYETEKSFVTYRGIRTTKPYFENLVVGETVVIDKGFMSTSLAKEEALIFSEDGIGESYLLDIKVKKGSRSGVYISELSDIPEEKEFLIKPSAKFKVISMKKNSSGINLISLELQND